MVKNMLILHLVEVIQEQYGNIITKKINGIRWKILRHLQLHRFICLLVFL